MIGVLVCLLVGSHAYGILAYSTVCLLGLLGCISGQTEAQCDSHLTSVMGFCPAAGLGRLLSYICGSACCRVPFNSATILKGEG